jgi:hypothetical protein
MARAVIVTSALMEDAILLHKFAWSVATRETIDMM